MTDQVSRQAVLAALDEVAGIDKWIVSDSAAMSPDEYEGARRSIAMVRVFVEALPPATPAGEVWQDIETAPKVGPCVPGWAGRAAAPYRISWGRNHYAQLSWCTAFARILAGSSTPCPAMKVPPQPPHTP